jgi:hypothetical protein
MRCLAVPVLKHGDTKTFWMRSLQLLRQLDLGMAKVVSMNESAYETNHDHRCRSVATGRNRLCCRISGVSCL